MHGASVFAWLLGCVLAAFVPACALDRVGLGADAGRAVATDASRPDGGRRPDATVPIDAALPDSSADASMDAPSGDVGTRDSGAGGLGPFGPAVRIDELSMVGVREDDPVLTEDLLEIFYNSVGTGVSDIWTSTRTAVGRPWAAGVPVTELNSAETETTPAVSADGLWIWFASQRGGVQTDLYVSSRPDRSTAWAPPSRISSLSTPAAESSPNVTPDLLRIVFDSDRVGMQFDLFESVRARPGDRWSAPTPLAPLNTAARETTPALDGSGLRIYFTLGTMTDSGEIQTATRASTSAPFGSPASVAEINTPSNENDPWVSPDGRWLFFTSNRAGDDDLYYARR